MLLVSRAARMNMYFVYYLGIEATRLLKRGSSYVCAVLNLRQKYIVNRERASVEL